ncbi:hypothetical protein ASE66_12360 [Bosea sp. Root483D1]|uniref:DUF1236 domain-containing protein n=1 Tax=Bosea sp. Root483D1 TaxID=1736544 RepID=UPI00070ACEE5|nr:DUF1236 domain-containing protein [Bosea sp. Root483D1]KRE15633.1 hypothetical protein ASE66_12360 [Bosea sp. Root483D1]
MLKHALLAAGLVLSSSAVMAQNQGQPNGLPEPPGISSELTPRFQRYVVEQRPTSYSYDQPVIVGTTLPATGVTYYPVPAEYGVSAYRYTVVNNRPVLVEPGTRRIVQVIN